MLTMSDLCRKSPSKYSCICFCTLEISVRTKVGMDKTDFGSSSMTFRAKRTNMHTAIGFRTTELPFPPAPSCCTILVMAILSFSRMRYSRPRAWYCMM